MTKLQFTIDHELTYNTLEEPRTSEFVLADVSTTLKYFFMTKRKQAVGVHCTVLQPELKHLYREQNGSEIRTE